MSERRLLPQAQVDLVMGNGSVVKNGSLQLLSSKLEFSHAGNTRSFALRSMEGLDLIQPWFGSNHIVFQTPLNGGFVGVKLYFTAGGAADFYTTMVELKSGHTPSLGSMGYSQANDQAFAVPSQPGTVHVPTSSKND
eukprot:TRINITY_DN10318_c0_g1_i1.p2 TRINITY_DN10318_c0_g1~~TRINITY_DN10318_c0_g1_i1.p2  ORF type:complete len:137 (+),score=20.89 TRINITY_DN10318_c0_g1_i1:264-674(+)